MNAASSSRPLIRHACSLLAAFLPLVAPGAAPLFETTLVFPVAQKNKPN